MKTNDILFLEKRLKELMDSEQYEKVAIIKRWIKELVEKVNEMK